jgi:hypothetical protein
MQCAQRTHLPCSLLAMLPGLALLVKASQSANASHEHDAAFLQQEKLIRSVCTAPLDKDDVLDLVMRFVGIGEHLYAAGVNRR